MKFCDQIQDEFIIYHKVLASLVKDEMNRGCWNWDRYLWINMLNDTI